jgi:hypothetical protein
MTPETVTQDVPVDKASLERAFYGDRLSAYVFLLLLGAGLLVSLLGFLSYVLLNQPKPLYFRVSGDGRVFGDKPLSDPLYTEAQIRDWAAQSAVRIYNFNFLNYLQGIMDVKPLFTEAGYAMFIDSVKPVLLPLILNERYVTKLSLCGAAQSQALPDDPVKPGLAWRVTLPAYLRLQNARRTDTKVFQIFMDVRRVSNLQYEQGLAVDGVAFSDMVSASGIGGGANLPVCNQ